LLTELRAIGNNLNQLAHHANATGGNIERKHLAEAISSLKEAMARVIAL
jgi:CHASE2 domain-containing sensor protein